MPSATNSRSRHSSANVRNTQPASITVKDKKDKPKVTADAVWVEPPLDQPKPSYEDHGGSAFGVLEDMLPLGQGPNAKVKARVRGEPLSKKLLGKSVAGIASDTQDTPEATPAPQEPLPTQPLLIFDDERDQDYKPKTAKKTTTDRASRSSLARAAVSSPANPSTHIRSTPAIPSDLPVLEQPTGAPATAQSPNPASLSSRPSTIPDPNLSELGLPGVTFSEVMEGVMRRANEMGDVVLGEALQDAYNNGQNDQHLMTLFKAIIGLNSTTEDELAFRSYIGKAKRRVKRRHTTSKHRTNGAISSAPDSPQGQSQLPELVPRPSIEAPLVQDRPSTKIKLRMGGPTQKSSIKIPSDSKVRSDKAREVRRSGSLSSLTSIESFSSLEEIDAMDIGTDNDANPGGDANGQNNADPAMGQGPLPNIPPDFDYSHAQRPGATNPRKRTSADIAADEREQLVNAKKQKMSEHIDREDRSEPSFARTERTESSGIGLANGIAIIPPPMRLVATGQERQPTASGTPIEIGSGSESELSPPPSFMPGTPQAATTKSIKKKAKTKQSPTKVQTARDGGDANGIGGRESPIGNDDNESDNNDFCSSCHGTGFLLCCDGCDRSFHFACVDPPLTQNAKELQEPWFCYKCVAKRAQPQRHSRGLFSALLSNLDKTNSSNFSLPKEVREYYDGVATGKDGRFMEAVNNKTRSRAGYDELPDNLKTKDSKGQSILCCQCHKSSLGRREIITCDSCAAHWHLDCLDPPLANPPSRDGYGKKVRDWLCPRHVEHELREMSMSRVAGRVLERERKVSMRRPRNARVVDTSLNRGFINNGIIEVINDESEEEEDFYEEEVSGTVYRLPEKGIILDFIDKVNKTRLAPQPVQALIAPPSQLSNPDFVRRSFAEQRTALQLVQLANQDTGLDISSDQVEILIANLIAEAPADVVALFKEEDKQRARSRKEEVQNKKKKLEMLQALIAKQLEALNQPQE